ncbi:hypothetical protein FSP39_009389 [Pinctada imbricata]|uniref:FAD dependent oxidoreductase domain-containing protein n=1 Tax=Pinctada imbricata TaxID=66713 RepID=A0AA89BVA4_PINIB|nr:hypothetical protein FSP39_009389 [Pinctada imbricata]
MSGLYDVAVIGGGVVGCSVLHELTSSGYRCVLLEKNSGLVSEASAGNSGMLHTGFDALEKTELSCIQYTQKNIWDVLHKTGIPYHKIGATMIGWNEEQKSKLQEIRQKSEVAGTKGTREISISTLYQMEPHVRHGAHGALWIPEETVVDPWLTAVTLAHQARRKNATILTDTVFEGCQYNGSHMTLNTNKGHLNTKCAVNSAGVYGDIVDIIAGCPNFRIKPRKGQYMMYSQKAHGLINSSILPVPTGKGKGIIVFKSVYDNVIVGPTAEETDIRSKPPIDDSVTKRLMTVADNVVPKLHENRVVRMYTGVRPATDIKDYQLHCDVKRKWITAGGIRSTGLSGCLGIAHMVLEMVREQLGIEASYSENRTLTRQNVVMETNGTAMIDGIHYEVTHPIALCKRERTPSLL